MAEHLPPAYRLLRGSVDVDGGNARAVHAAESLSSHWKYVSPRGGGSGCGAGDRRVQRPLLGGPETLTEPPQPGVFLFSWLCCLLKRPGGSGWPS